jgi:hypothetical protein
LNYSNKSSIVVPNLIWNAESANIYTEGILSEFNIKFDRNLLCKSSQNYTFFNKTTVYQNYKKTLPGLYYINKPTENNSFELVELTNTTVNKISIKNTKKKKIDIGRKLEKLFCNSANFIFNIIRTNKKRTAIAPT